MSCILEIIVPVHDVSERSAHLERMLTSNSHQAVNFIIVLDSDLDSDQLKISRIVNHSLNPMSKVITGAFNGPGLARNKGILISEAKWISFLDSDDDIDLDELIALVSKAETNLAQLAIGGISYLSGSNENAYRYFINPKISLYENLGLTPAFTRMIFHRDLLSENSFPKFKMAEDQCFVLDVLSQSPKIYLEEKYFYTYNLGVSSQATRDLAALKDLVQSVEYISSRFNSFNADIKRVASIMIIRQSITYFTRFNRVFERDSQQIIRTLAKFLFSHPILVFSSSRLIFFHRPRGAR